jgi:hypothetical protein
MKKATRRRLLSLLLVLGLVAAACGETEDSAGTGSETERPADGSDADGGAAEGEAAEGEAAAGPLAEVCPATVVIQTDWFPESEHGALFQLIGDDYEIDADAKRVSGSLVLGGEDLGVDVEIRAGGPAIGSGKVGAEMYVDDDIMLGYGNTDGQILTWEDTPLVSVMAPLERNPQIIYWDPDTHPGVETIADLGEAGVTVNVFPGVAFSEVFVALGILSEDQIDPSYDGSPARFVSEGDIAQQGFASAEVWIYENQVEDYGRAVAYQLLDDAGFTAYSQTLAVRAAELEELSPCLTELIPVVQQATVDYYADPAETNELIVEAVAEYDTFWTYPAELADFSVTTQLDLGLAGNGPDDVVGNMEEARVGEVIDFLNQAEMDVPADLTPGMVMTNEFIDDSIGFE